MISVSRRQLARYAVDQLLAKQSVKSVANHLAAALIASGRRHESELLLSDIDLELEERGLVAKATVTSAHPISDKLINSLSARLKKLSNVEAVVLDQQIDESVIGGIKVETASRTIDKTIKKELLNLREAA